MTGDILERLQNYAEPSDIDYTPRYLYGVGASFERQKLLVVSRPRTYDYLSRLAAGNGDLFYPDGEAGDGYQNLIDDATAFRDMYQALPQWPAPYSARVDIGIAGLSGGSIQDSIDYTGPEYPSLDQINQLIDLLFEFCNKVIVISMASLIGRDVGYLRANGVTDVGFQSYLDAWADQVGSRTDVIHVDAYADWVDSSIPYPWLPEYNDYHPTSNSCYVAAQLLWEQILRTLPRDV